ncbi:MAG: hypothetical protein M1826_005551, partial [Phylliscum demangeonii]
SAAHIIQVIGPFAKTAVGGVSARGLVPLKKFIQETLRRSRTTYSTLQVARASARALRCGRRMFLGVLMLASKYLQDRSY